MDLKMNMRDIQLYSSTQIKVK